MEFSSLLAFKPALLCVLAVAALSVCRSDGTRARAERIGAVFSGLVSPDEPGAAILVRKDGRTVFEHGYGVADLRTKRPIDGRTNFRLASVTKQFTAAAVMLLVHDGKLRYDDRLTDIFPAFPAYGRAVTIRHLLNHTSGLPETLATTSPKTT